MRYPKDLRPFQRKAAWRLYTEPSVGLLVDMGLGKTISVLTAIRALIRNGKRHSALVVVPLRVLQTRVWQNEAKAWSHTKDLTFSIVHGNDDEKMRGIMTKADIYITNYESLKWFGLMAGRKSKKSKIPMPDILALDESSYVKSHKALRFKVFKFRLLRFFKTVTILTGTPMPNSLMEIYTQIYMLDQGARLGTSYTRFKTRFFEPVDYRQFKWEPREGAQEKVLELIKDIVIRLDQKDWVKMPDIVSNTIQVQLPSDVRRTYNAHEHEMFIELGGGKSITAVNAATLSMQCQQIANGAVYDDEEDRTSWTALHEAKLDALQEIISEHDGQSIMVAHWFRHDLERLRLRWPRAAVLDRKDPERTVEDWNRGRIPLLFIHPRGSGHGLNMQHGGHIIVFFSLTWSLEAHDQLIGRLRRTDQKSDNILCHYLVCQDTVDEAIMAALAHKADGQRAVLDALRAYTRRRLG